ncbi:MAG: MFS transporter [Gemmatimonadota bacterium]
MTRREEGAGARPSPGGSADGGASEVGRTVETGGAASGRRVAFAGSLTHPTAVAVALAVAHAANDAYAAFLHPLLPRVMEKLGLSIALAATLAMTLSLAASVAQPLLGYWADRYGRRPLVAAGPLLTGVFLSLIGVAPSFAVLLLVLALGGLGSAAFHPPGASLAARVAEGGGSGVRLSWFSFGGALGYAAGPLIAVGLVAWLGLGGLTWAMIPAVALAGALWWLLPAEGAAGGEAVDPPPGPRRILALLRGPLGAVFGISALGAFVQRVFLTMEPIIVDAAGGTEAVGALALSVYLGGQAFGSLTGGYLADRVDRRWLLAVLATAAVPAHLLALGLSPGGAAALAAAAASGFLNMAMLPAVVVIAQEIVPAGAAVGSGIAMGLAWAAGSIGVLATGALGDLVGARAAALASVPLLLIGSLLALHPALREHGRAPEPVGRVGNGASGSAGFGPDR